MINVFLFKSCTNLANTDTTDMKKQLWATFLMMGLAFHAAAQTQYQNTGWFMFLNNTKFNDKWGLQFDAQFRSVDDWKYVRNTLVRPALQYFINKNNNVALGYLWQTTQTQLNGTRNYLSEHRIFEQYIYTHNLGQISASHRFRIEQRFIGREFDSAFAQRFRYFFRFIQPLQKRESAFVKGAFLALQNEIFLNIQNKSETNNSFFDQNRAYLAAGYRFSKEVDLEIGYLNQAVHGLTNNTVNNVVQLALYTRF